MFTSRLVSINAHVELPWAVNRARLLNIFS